MLAAAGVLYMRHLCEDIIREATFYCDISVTKLLMMISLIELKCNEGQTELISLFRFNLSVVEISYRDGVWTKTVGKDAGIRETKPIMS